MDEAAQKAVASLNAASNYASNAAYFLEHRDELLADAAKGWSPESIDEEINGMVHASETLLDDAKTRLSRGGGSAV